MCTSAISARVPAALSSTLSSLVKHLALARRQQHPRRHEKRSEHGRKRVRDPHLSLGDEAYGDPWLTVAGARSRVESCDAVSESIIMCNVNHDGCGK